MATANNVQREPSMEEILASIRRIIEDSDTGRKQPDDGVELRQDLEPSSAVSEADSFRSELRGAVDLKKPVTLAEVQAQIAAEAAPAARFDAEAVRSSEPAVSSGEFVHFGRDETAGSTKTEEGKAASTDAVIAEWRRDLVVEKASASYPKANEAEVTGNGEPMAFDAGGPAQSIAEPARTAEAAHTAPAVSSGEDFAKPSLVSEQTSRQVAAAFGELSEAFASRSKKTFDDMAEEMLRPMLQDWLDNNLPTLVERLVREEIERVARGS